MHYTQRTSCVDTFIRDTWQSFYIWSCAVFQLHIDKKNANNELNVYCWYCFHCEWKNIFSQEEMFCNFSFSFPFLALVEQFPIFCVSPQNKGVDMRFYDS